MKLYNATIASGSKILICGPPGSGKTHFVFDLLRHGNRLFSDTNSLQNVIFFYQKWQPLYDENISLVREFCQDPPSLNIIEEKTAAFSSSVVVLDDALPKLDSDLYSLFLVDARHAGITVIFLSQSMFAKQKIYREISLSATYVVLFKNPRCMRQIANFIMQSASCNGQSEMIWKIIKKVYQKPHSYLFLDFCQESDENIKYRTDIFNSAIRVFCPNNMS